MKVVTLISVLLIVGTCAALSVIPVEKPVERSLQDDIRDFWALIPVQRIVKIVIKYVLHDREVRDLFIYLRSKHFVNLVKEILQLEEVQALIKYLKDLANPPESLVNQLIEIIENPNYDLVSSFDVAAKGSGVLGLVREILRIIPREELRALYRQKMENSPDFRRFIEGLQSAEFGEHVTAVLGRPEVQRLFLELHEHGVDFAAIIDMLLNGVDNE